MKKILLVLIIPVFIGSCKTSKMKFNNNDEYQKRILGNVMGLNRLKISARFDECGEWGGHNETFEIYRKDKILFADFTQDIVDCNDLYSEKREFAEQKTIKLTKSNEKAIVKYLQSLLKVGLKMELPFHAGSYYTAIMSDSTMILKYHYTGSNWNEYNKLKTELNN